MPSASGGRLRPRRLLLLGGAFAFVFLVLATFTQGATNDLSDPRNKSLGQFSGGDPAKDCWRHHKTEGMRDTHVIVPIFPRALKVGEVRPAQIQIENPWKHGISEYEITLSVIPDAQGHTHIEPQLGLASGSYPSFERRFEGELFNRNLRDTVGTPLPDDVPVDDPRPELPPSKVTLNFTLPGTPAPEVDYMIIDLNLTYPEGAEAPTNPPNTVTANVTPPGTSAIAFPDESENDRSLRFPYQDIVGDAIRPSPGTWNVDLLFAQGKAATVRYTVSVRAEFKVAEGVKEYPVVRQLREPSEGGVPQIVVQKNSVTTPITVLLNPVSKGTQLMEVKVSALLWWDHQAETTPNEDRFFRYYNITIEVGDQFVPSSISLAEGSVSQVHFYQQAGEITGFAAAFMLVPSLLFGGTYGRNSRKLFNALLGGAKRRVMFHNLLSLGLILVSFVHILLFLLEVRYTILMGMLFGGLGALSLLVLGLTGYYQVPLIQRFGYNWWRYVHLAFGVLVVVFVSYHAIVDGPDFFFLEEQLPAALRDLNLAQK